MLACVLITIPSCTSLEDMKTAMGFVDIAQAHIQEQQKTLAYMEEQLLELDASLLGMEEGPRKEQTQKLRDKLSSAVNAAKVVLTELELSLLTVREAVLEAEYIEDVITPITKKVGTFLPAPYDIIVTAAGGLIAICITGVRTANAKRAAKEIVVGIENAKVDDMVRMSTVKMGLAGKALVDSVQATTIVEK